MLFLRWGRLGFWGRGGAQLDVPSGCVESEMPHKHAKWACQQGSQALASECTAGGGPAGLRLRVNLYQVLDLEGIACRVQVKKTLVPSPK